MTNDSGREDPAVPVGEQASDWWVLLNAGEATAADHKAFGEWAARSPERIEAFLETARITKLLKADSLRWPQTSTEVLARQAAESGGDVLQLRQPSSSGAAASVATAREANKGARPAPSRLRRYVVAAAAAAGMAGIALLVAALMHRFDAQYATVLGEQRSMPLADGSIVTLNTASRIEVKFDGQRRLIRLLAGEALFRVARDPTRPFEVTIDGTRVRAVGTQFNVNRGSRGTVVTVVEGKVAVLSATATNKPSQDAAPALTVTRSTHEQAAPNVVRVPAQTGEIYLSGGEQVTVANAGEPELQAELANLDVATAWTQRRLVFDHRPIAEVAEEFNRYNHLQIEIASAALRSEQMTGVFQANDPDSFLDFLARMPGVKLDRDAGAWKVSASL